MKKCDGCMRLVRSDLKYCNGCIHVMRRLRNIVSPNPREPLQ